MQETRHGTSVGERVASGTETACFALRSSKHARMMRLTLNQALACCVRATPDSPAIMHGTQTLSYAQFDLEVRRLAQGFADCGISAGDRVALWLPSIPAWLTSFFALARLGAVAVATNTRFRALEVTDLFSRAGISALVWCPDYRGIDFRDILREVQPGVPSLHTLITCHEEAASPGQDAPAAAAFAGLREIPYETLGAAAPYARDDAAPDAVCAIQTTSGSTRKPKLVMQAQGGMVEHARDVGVAFGYTRTTSPVLNALPLSGTFGMTQALACLLNGVPLILQSTFDAQEAVGLMRRHRVALGAMTDEMIRRIYEAAEDAVPFPGMELFTGSRADKLLELGQRRGFRINGVYGSTEAQALFARGRDSDEPLQRTLGGGLPVSPHARVRATDLDTGALLAHGQAGQLEFSSPSLTVGYYNDPEANAAAFTADGFFRTGDLGHTDADGGFRYLARLGDTLRLRGFLVSPTEIESFIGAAAGVEHVQVVGADDRAGEPCAVAFYTTGPYATVADHDLLHYCRQGMASYKVPARFIRVDEFPVIRSPNAVKIDRNALRQQAAAALQT